MSLHLSVRLKLKISVTTELIGFYSSGYIPISPVVILSYYLVGWDTSNYPKKQKNPPTTFFIFFKLFKIVVEWGHLKVMKDVIIPLGAKSLEARANPLVYNTK